MKLKELKDYLNELPESMNDYQVILQKDSEGNDYSPLDGLDSEVVYVADSKWSGSVYIKDWSAYDCFLEEDEWESLKNNPNNQTIVLYPVN